MTHSIETLWRTPTRQCELLLGGIRCRLRLWIDGCLVVNEEISDLETLLRRSGELEAAFGAGPNGRHHPGDVPELHEADCCVTRPAKQNAE